MTSPSSTPLGVSESILKLLDEHYEAAFDCGNHRVGDNPTYDIKHARSKAANAALFTAIAALEMDKARLDRVLGDGWIDGDDGRGVGNRDELDTLFKKYKPSIPDRFYSPPSPTGP